MIKAAILGAGIGAEHLKGYRALPDRFSVVAICDLDTERAAKVIGDDASIRSVGDMEEVFADPEIDLIDICLPPQFHAPCSIKALDAGKQAVCEKPIAKSLAEAETMQAAVERTGGRIFPVFQYRYGPAFAQLAALREAGLAGRPLVASAETHWNRGSAYYAVPWRGTWAGEAGGAILGHAIHSHDLLCKVFGPVAELTAYTDTLVNEIETEDCAAISMRMENGALVTSSVTLGASPDTSRLKFCFEGLSAESGTAPYAPAKDRWTFTARGATKQEDIDRVLATVPTQRAGFEGFLEAVADAMEGRGGNEVSFADGRRSIEFVTAVYLSARQGRPVKLPLGETDLLYDGWVPA
ncbi:MAG: Gfo/Idh/MocA family oxidoreductase [Pseudomonadota bacterium]